MGVGVGVDVSECDVPLYPLAWSHLLFPGHEVQLHPAFERRTVEGDVLRKKVQSITFTTKRAPSNPCTQAIQCFCRTQTPSPCPREYFSRSWSHCSLLSSPSPVLLPNSLTLQPKPATAPSWTLSTRQSSENGVNIIAGSTGSATAYDSEVHAISDTGLGTFGLAGDALKAAVGAYAGCEPNDAFVRRPTPWDDLYTKYSWPQVTTTIRAVSAEVIDQSVEPVIVAEVPLNNTSSRAATFDASANREVGNTVSRSWSNSGSFTVTQTVNYEVRFQGASGGVETSFGFSRGWGESGEESQTIVVGRRSGASVELEAGEAVYAWIRASRGAMKVRVTHLATVGGFVACNYNPRHNGHHFWA